MIGRAHCKWRFIRFQIRFLDCHEQMIVMEDVYWRGRWLRPRMENWKIPYQQCAVGTHSTVGLLSILFAMAGPTDEMMNLVCDGWRDCSGWSYLTGHGYRYLTSNWNSQNVWYLCNIGDPCDLDLWPLDLKVTGHCKGTNITHTNTREWDWSPKSHFESCIVSHLLLFVPYAIMYLQMTSFSN